MSRNVLPNALLTACALVLSACSGASDKPAIAAESPSHPPAANTAQASGDYAATLDQEIARAHQERLQGSLEEAKRTLGQLMLAAPDDGRVVSEYGKLLVQVGQPAEGAQFLERALSLHTQDWSIYSALGVAYDQLDRHADARRAYEQALTLKPDAPAVLNNYAVSRMLTGDLAGAEKLLAQAGASGDPRIQGNLAMLAEMHRNERGTASAQAAPPMASAHPAPQPPAPSHVAAAAPPRSLQPAKVMMQKVPYDPQAGPVPSKHQPEQHTRLAAAHTSSHAAKTAPAKPVPAKATTTTAAATKKASADHLPMLRTAAGGP